MKKRTDAYLVEQALDIESRSAYDAGKIGYIPKFMTSLPLPVGVQKTNEYERRNGKYRISLIAPSSIGLPSGGLARRLLIYCTTIAKITKSNEIYSGRTFSEFAKILGLHRSGGPSGSIGALRSQFKRLFSTNIQWVREEAGEWSVDTLNIARSASILWNPLNSSEHESFITLGEVFYEEIQLNAVPIDLRVIDTCSHYPMAIDIYCFLTSRYFRMPNPVLIPWSHLVEQSGCSYKKLSNFKRSYKTASERVKFLYPEARFSFKDNGMLLMPSPPHVPRRKKAATMSE